MFDIKKRAEKIKTINELWSDDILLTEFNNTFKDFLAEGFKYNYLNLNNYREHIKTTISNFDEFSNQETNGRDFVKILKDKIEEAKDKSLQVNDCVGYICIIFCLLQELSEDLVFLKYSICMLLDFIGSHKIEYICYLKYHRKFCYMTFIGISEKLKNISWFLYKRKLVIENLKYNEFESAIKQFTDCAVSKKIIEIHNDIYNFQKTIREKRNDEIHNTSVNCDRLEKIKGLLIYHSSADNTVLKEVLGEYLGSDVNKKPDDFLFEFVDELINDSKKLQEKLKDYSKLLITKLNKFSRQE